MGHFQNVLVYSSNLGFDVSGGSDATMHILSRVMNQLPVEGVCYKLNQPHLCPFPVKIVADENELIDFLQSRNTGRTLFYGDFMDAEILADLDLPYVFSYHDNWPGLAVMPSVSEKEKQEAISAYASIFRKALLVFPVSQYGLEFASRYTPHAAIIRNGFKPRAYQNPGFENHKIIMLGNVDERKYGLLPRLMDALAVQKVHVEIDVYGHLTDQGLSEKIGKLPGIRLKGFDPEPKLSDYALLLSVSYMENLPISMVEAVHAGMQVVGFDVGGVGELINNSCGILIPAYDEIMMAAAIDSILTYPRATQNKHLPQQYSWELASETFLNEINKLIP